MTEERIAERTRRLLAEHGLHLKKSLGQNFLTDRQVLDRMIEAAGMGGDTGVLEIGPGIGALTERLAQEAKKVVAVELDQRLLPLLNQLFADRPHVGIHHGDAMEIDFHRLIREQLAGCSPIHVVANLPYYVTSPILMRLLEEQLPLDRIVIMIQKEVAERMMAEPGSKAYGALTVAVRYYTTTQWVTRVPAHVFVPRPRVDSAVVRLDVRPRPAVSVRNESLFFAVVRAAFGQRRKTLSNALSHGLFTGKQKGKIIGWLEEAGIDPQRRGETLSLEEFARLANRLDEVEGVLI
ncbi:MAG: 16S rRNA (adenine(1518)-N(6)/adenine(1519)-N(6))-dimethyltransferase RsmA [Firmicutes bacterium]|uniref:Ribosomal RNA small subunit methyltransferase A n=2 Tax=Melghirimyces thermohalophilus TaxID=1236220 RepID=A0A1G6Q1R4_9BACL|nr:16S rRNA (adenine(1518)-N(6)/adenine(1519)-N(6))-dimethyltransferase RsmA [Melghirimyces thermohalophilus]MDA8354199.1 16S rRNA (adenine(1518)-N(6)/adenine(1519)-N(6))-dimethyltransferase RsmA [Bacillota bacterium]SDC85854.1 16S rRNA (adenine1518-N6/adenine1519-N6)-dimethyltransferase [Melghirimyces thermohalophilus]